MSSRLRRTVIATTARQRTVPMPEMDPRAGALVDPDDGGAGLDRQVHDLDDLLAVDLAERAAEDGHVLAEDRDGPAVDRAVAGDDAVAVRAVLLDAEVVRAVEQTGALANAWR